jgi:hypothetical protein
MRLFIDDKPVAVFSQRQMREVAVARQQDEAIETFVLDLDAADGRVARAGRFFYGGLGLLVAILIGALVVGATFDGDTSDLTLILPVAFVVALICLFLLRWAYRRGLRAWEGRRLARAAALARPGTRVLVDAHRLAIGEAWAGWPNLVVEALYFNRIAVAEDTSYRIERLSLFDGRRFMLDRDFLGQGEAVVQRAYAKLIVEPGLGELKGEMD